MSPSELHAFVRDYNWDDGHETIVALLDDPAVDRATALLAYWRLQGPWATYAPGQDSEHPHRRVVDQIHDRLLSGWYAGPALTFDATIEIGLTKVQLYKLRKAGMPDELLRA